MSLRTRAREIALQLLYQDEMNKDRTTTDDLAFIKNRLNNIGDIVSFAQLLVDGVRNKTNDIDQQLGSVSENWRLSRMAVTDRNVLRLGAFEILFHDTPGKVAINEAVDIARRYGTDSSAHFINGILDRLYKSKDNPIQPATTSDPSVDTEDPSSIESSHEENSPLENVAVDTGTTDNTGSEDLSNDAAGDVEATSTEPGESESGESVTAETATKATSTLGAPLLKARAAFRANSDSEKPAEQSSQSAEESTEAVSNENPESETTGA